LAPSELKKKDLAQIRKRKTYFRVCKIYDIATLYNERKVKVYVKVVFNFFYVMSEN